MLPLVKNLGLKGSLTLNISTKRVANCNYLSKNTFRPTCLFFNICFVMSHVISMFKISFFLVGCVYFLMVFAIDGGPLDRLFILFVAFLFGLFLVLGKLETFVLGDNTSSYAYFEVWSNVICSFMSSKIRV